MRRPVRALTAVAATALAAGCTTTATASAATQATVTGYKAGSPSTQSAGPVTVVLQGKKAASLSQLLNRLPKGGTMQCMENVLLYNITFSLSGSPKKIDVAGYACAAAVQVTQNGKTTLRTDSHCTLLAAVRKVLPASAVATERASAGCDR